MNNLDRRNRLAAFVLSALLLAAGIYGLLRSYERLGRRRAEDAVLLRGLRDFVADSEPWFWFIAFVLALLVAYLGYRWLRAQLSPSPSLSELTMDESQTGRTTMPTKALAEAVTRELEDDPDVSSARVRVVGSEREPSLDVRASLIETADLDEARQRIENDVVSHAREATERSDLTAKVRIKLGEPTPRMLA